MINSEVNTVLETLVKRSNEGFDGGEVTKSDVASLLLLSSAKSFSDSEIKTLRATHFDEKKMLRTLLKQSSDDVDLPDHIKKALREHYGMTEYPKKRAVKNGIVEPKVETRIS